MITRGAAEEQRGEAGHRGGADRQAGGGRNRAGRRPATLRSAARRPGRASGRRCGGSSGSRPPSPTTQPPRSKARSTGLACSPRGFTPIRRRPRPRSLPPKPMAIWWRPPAGSRGRAGAAWPSPVPEEQELVPPEVTAAVSHPLPWPTSGPGRRRGRTPTVRRRRNTATGRTWVPGPRRRLNTSAPPTGLTGAVPASPRWTPRSPMSAAARRTTELTVPRSGGGLRSRSWSCPGSRLSSRDCNGAEAATRLRRPGSGMTRRSPPSTRRRRARCAVAAAAPRGR